MLLMWMALSLAQAFPCDVETTAADFASLASRAEEAIAAEDIVGHARVFSEIRDRASCLQEQAPAREWARLLVTFAVVQHALDRAWREPLTAAMVADPEVDTQAGPPDIRGYPRISPDESHWPAVAGDAAFYLDGRPVERVPPGAMLGPHLAQSFADDRWETLYLVDEPYPWNWLAPTTAPHPESTWQPEPEPEKVAVSTRFERVGYRSPVPLATGAGLVALGTGTGVATWAATLGRDRASIAQERTLKIANVVGWSAAGIGTGLVTVHVATGGLLTVGPGHLRLAGRF